MYAWLELTVGWIFTPWLYSLSDRSRMVFSVPGSAKAVIGRVGRAARSMVNHPGRRRIHPLVELVCGWLPRAGLDYRHGADDSKVY